VSTLEIITRNEGNLRRIDRQGKGDAGLIWDIQWTAPDVCGGGGRGKRRRRANAQEAEVVDQDEGKESPIQQGSQGEWKSSSLFLRVN
jgi:hypothetical protein